MSVGSRIREWVQIIAAHGAEVERVEQGKHLRFVLTSGQVVVLAKTPTCSRGDANSLAQLRRLLGWQRPAKPAPKPVVAKRAPAPAPEPPSRRQPGPPGPPQRLRNEHHRARLGLDGRTTPVARRFDWGERPIIRLRTLEKEP
jgi:hypothetical protein